MSNTQLVRQFGNVEIHARPEDNYVNATQLCKLAGKQWNDYRRLKRTEGFLSALSTETGIPVSVLIEVQKGTPEGTGRGAGQGSWMHPLVMVNFITWASPKFEVQVTKWAFELMSTGRVELSRVDDPPPLLPADWATMIRTEIAAVLSERLPALAGARVSGPFWTVDSRIEDKYPHWRTTAKERHKIGQMGRRMVNSFLNEQVSYFNRDLAFTAHQIYYLDKAIDKVYRESCCVPVGAGAAPADYGLFRDYV